MNQLGFVETIDGLDEGVVVGNPDASDRRFDASLSQTLGVKNCKRWPGVTL